MSLRDLFFEPVDADELDQSHKRLRRAPTVARFARDAGLQWAFLILTGGVVFVLLATLAIVPVFLWRVVQEADLSTAASAVASTSAIGAGTAWRIMNTWRNK